jgi:tetratricopeptide (TPR) repeat protein
VQSNVAVGDNKGTVIGTNIGTQIINQLQASTALHQLRAPVNDFVGRDAEITQLVKTLRQAAESGAVAAISGVRGMGGIGKTELAYKVALELRDAFPDAQLLVELRGATDNPIPSTQALQTVIRAFEREAKLPDALDELKQVYNSVLTGKRVLILADDAKDAAQVRPLLPPPGCGLLVTSRNHFALPGMATLDLRTLPEADAEALLCEICPRICADAMVLAKLCGYLPLALRVSASFLAARPSRPVDEYVQQLKDERIRLEKLRDPHDPELDVAASLRLSYDALDEATQSALCQLSVFVTSFDRDAARAVVAVSEGEKVDEVLDELCRLSLLEWDEKVERYSVHELVRVFGARQLTNSETVWHRYAQHYAQVADSARRLYHQGGAQLASGLALFDRERTHIDQGWDWAQAQAGKPAADAVLLDMSDATALTGDLRYDRRRERIPQLEAALAAARRLNERGAEGAILGNLGNAYADLGETRKAIEFHNQALLIDREIGDRGGEGSDLGNLGNAYAELGEMRKAIDFYEQRLVVAREIGDRRGEAYGSWNMGLALEKEGNLAQAVLAMQLRVDFEREIGHPKAEEHAKQVEQLRQRIENEGGAVGA